jgi:hypothetical protein
MSAEGIRDQVEIPNPAADTPASPPAELSLRDEIASRLEAVKTAPEGETVEQRDQRVRDEQGRFAEKPKEARRPVLTVKPDAQAATPAVVDPAAPPVPAAPAVKPPDGWTAAAKAKFDKLDPDIQAEIIRRETDMHRQFTTQDQDRTFGKKIRETATPFMATILSEGGNVEQAFQQFLTTAQIMRGNNQQLKAQALRQVAQQFNVELGQPLQQAPQDQQFETLNQRLDRLERERQEEIQQRQVQEQSALTSEIDAFKAEPGHEHFEAVKTLMGTLLQSGQATNLKEAYDQAIWANPEIRSTLTAAQTANAEQKRLTDLKDRSGAAKWAAGSITGGPGGVKPNGAAVERSLGEEIRANMQAALGRV